MTRTIPSASRAGHARSHPSPIPIGLHTQAAIADTSPAEKIPLTSHRQSAFVKKPDTDINLK